MKEEIIKFLNLNLLNFKLSSRTSPNNNKEQFINKITFKNNLSNKVSVQTENEFYKLVNKKCFFIASISSTITDIFILNELFFGLGEKITKNILKHSVNFNTELYFDFENIEKSIYNFKRENTFNDYLTKLSITTQNLFVDSLTKMDLYNCKIINQNKIF